jgi:hypothetical protein
MFNCLNQIGGHHTLLLKISAMSPHCPLRRMMRDTWRYCPCYSCRGFMRIKDCISSQQLNMVSPELSALPRILQLFIIFLIANCSVRTGFLIFSVSTDIFNTELLISRQELHHNYRTLQ